MGSTPIYGHSGTNIKIFPADGASEAEYLAYRDRIINPWSQYRNQRMADVALWWAFYLGHQWVDIDPMAAFDGVRGAILQESDLHLPPDYPRPVTNEIDPGVEQAVIAMVQRKWTAKCTPTSDDPAIKAAAQVSTDILQHRLETLRWPEKRRQHAFHYVLGGTGLLYTGVDRTYTKLRVVGAPTAVWCQSCETKLYSPDVPSAAIRGGIEGRPLAFAESAKPAPIDATYDTDVMDQADQLDLMRLQYCPVCSDRANPLVPYDTLTQDEAEHDQDIFGRAMGLAEPSDQTTLEVDVPFEWYPQDGGYRQTPSTLQRWGRRKIREIQWIEERAPHLMDQIEPDSVAELLYGDPLLGGRDVLSRWSGALDAGILDHHKFVDEIVELPSIRYPYGRYMVALKQDVIEVGDLMIPAQVQADDINDEMFVPRVNIAIARCKMRPTDIWGNSIAAPAISPQKRLNGMDAQIIEHRMGFGNAEVWMPEDMWVANPVQIESAIGGRKIHFYKPSPSMPDVTKPEVVAGSVMTTDVYQERDRVQSDIKRRLGPQDATVGAPPGGVGTTSGLEFLVDRDLATHSLREEELIQSGEQAFSHLQKMEWLLQVDEQEYRVRGPNKTWSYRQYTGAAIRGQYETEIERGSGIPKTTVQREAAREAIADKLLPVESMSPVVRKEMLELYGLDPALAPEEFYQVDHAQRIWVDFRDRGVIRTQDTLDEPGIHYLVLRGHLRTEEGEQLADNIGWDDINRKIAGWQDELQRLEMLEAKAIAFYGGRLSPEEGKMAYGQALVAHDKAMKVFRQQQTTKNAMGPADLAVLGAQPPLEPPPPPPPPVFLPALLQDRILLVWAKSLGPLPPPAIDAGLAPGPDMRTFIQFRALVEAYRVSATAGMMPGPAPAPGPNENGNGNGEGEPEPNPGTSAPAPAVPSKSPTPEGGKN